jgi:predicted phosphodiesterase
MRIAVVSDIHSNLPALESVLRDLPEDVEQIWCLGDVVNYYAHPHECITRLRSDPRIDIACWLMGNHDAAVLGLVEAAQINQYGQATLAYTRDQLSSEDRAFLRARPLLREFKVGGIDTTIAHGSPDDPLWHYLRTAADAAQAAAATPSQLIIVGHTHIPQAFVEQEGTWQAVDLQSMHGVLPIGSHRLAVNVGSVGQPRDGNRRAAYLLIDTAQTTITFRRCRYSVSTERRAVWHQMKASAPPSLLRDLVERLNTGV